MNIEQIARLLEPLMPEKVTHWLNVRETADSELRDLIDQQIIMTARQKLGDYRNKILLSLPPQSKAKGTFELGTILYEQAKWPVGISRSELLNHVAIFGRSGAGKTNMTFHLLKQLSAKKIPWIFLDWKRTARHLLPDLKHNVNIFTPGRSLSPMQFNPFSKPPGIEDHSYVNQIVDVMAAAYTLGDGAKHLLQKALVACYQNCNHHPNASDIINELEHIANQPRQKQWKVTLLRALESFAFTDPEIPGTNPGTNPGTGGWASEVEVGSGGSGEVQETLMKSLLSRNSIVELDGLSDNAKKLLIPMFCQWLFFMKLDTTVREKLELVIVIEEAHHVLFRGEKKTNESVMATFIRMCRETGIAVIIVDQHPHLMSAAALGNTYTSICLNLKDPSDLSRAASLSTLDESKKHYFSQLPVGQAIVKLQDRWHRSFLLRIPHVNVAKGTVTDNLLRKYIQESRTESGRNTLAHGVFAQIRRIPLWDEALKEEAIAFIEDVVGFPQDGINQRYTRLGLSGSRGQKMKDGLIDKGWLESEVVSVGKTRKVLLRLTKRAEELLAIQPHEKYRASIAHEYWKRYYAAYFERLGWKVKIEAKRSGVSGVSGVSRGSGVSGVTGVSGVGRVDVLAWRDGKRIGIEIETGKSNVIQNVMNGLRAKLDQIIIVAVDQKAFKTVGKTLVEAGLLIPGKVKLVVQDQLTMNIVCRKVLNPRLI